MNIKIVCAALICAPFTAAASDLTFSFNNPAFGGNPGNTTYYLTMLENQKLPKESEDEQTALQQFSEDLERRILSTLSTTIIQQIFGENATPSGTFTAGGLTVTYETVGNEVRITISDGITTTTIVVPSVT